MRLTGLKHRPKTSESSRTIFSPTTIDFYTSFTNIGLSALFGALTGGIGAGFSSAVPAATTAAWSTAAGELLTTLLSLDEHSL